MTLPPPSADWKPGGPPAWTPGPGRAVAWAPYALLEAVPEDAEAPAGHFWRVLQWHRWKILGFVLAAIAATLGISLRLTPIYESKATLDIDRQAPLALLGPEAARGSNSDADLFLATQIRLIQSESVLRPVAERYDLGERESWFAAALPVTLEPAPGAPALLRQLRVERPRNTFLLEILYRSPDPALAADVANAVANSYLEHSNTLRARASADLARYMERELRQLKVRMEGSSERLAGFERELKVINPEEKTNIVSARLLLLNTEHTAAQTDRVRKQAAYASLRDGSLAAAQASSQGEALKRLAERENEAQEKFAEVRVHFGANHPEYKKAAARLAEMQRLLERARLNIAQRVEVEYREAAGREALLGEAVAETRREFDRLNARSFEYQTLKREAEADKKLYEELVRKIQEAGINASFQNSAIRVADPARPAGRPVFPRIGLNLALACLVSALLAAGAAIARDALDKTLRDPEQAARVLKTEVIGSLPAVKTWRRELVVRGPGLGKLVVAKRLPAAAAVPDTALLQPDVAGHASAAGYGEAIRSLHHWILHGNFDCRVRSLLVTSAAAGEGKSTVAAHLASTHAGQRRKTLLIDGDLRRPTLHKRLRLPGAIGLSNVLVDELPWREAVLKAPVEGLDLLPAGSPLRHATDLAGGGIAELIEEAANEYDLVILDAPPLGGFAEPLQMATAADGVLMVARAGETHRAAVASALGALARARANVLGLALNEVHPSMRSQYYGYRYHGMPYADRKELGPSPSPA